MPNVSLSFNHTQSGNTITGNATFTWGPQTWNGYGTEFKVVIKNPSGVIIQKSSGYDNFIYTASGSYQSVSTSLSYTVPGAGYKIQAYAVCSNCVAGNCQHGDAADWMLYSEEYTIPYTEPKPDDVPLFKVTEFLENNYTIQFSWVPAARAVSYTIMTSSFNGYTEEWSDWKIDSDFKGENIVEGDFSYNSAGNIVYTVTFKANWANSQTVAKKFLIKAKGSTGTFSNVTYATKYNNSEIAVCRHYGIHVKNNDNPVAVFAKANGKWEECYLFIKNTNNSNIASANYWHCTY